MGDVEIQYQMYRSLLVRNLGSQVDMLVVELEHLKTKTKKFDTVLDFYKSKGMEILMTEAFARVLACFFSLFISANQCRLA